MHYKRGRYKIVYKREVLNWGWETFEREKIILWKIIKEFIKNVYKILLNIPHLLHSMYSLTRSLTMGDTKKGEG